MAKKISSKQNWYFRFAFFATVLALCVIMLGAFTRLKGAGLGCPDWPGCYGQMIVPHTHHEMLEATALYPNEPIEPAKAWHEMVHRYFAAALGLFIIGLAIAAFVRRRSDPAQPILVPLFLLIIVIFQAALGMWTVTWKLLPLVVMGHLLGGMTVFALLAWLTLQTGGLLRNHTITMPSLRPFAILGLIIVAIQIFLGGWTSSNYASLACAGFPFCSGHLFPPMEFQKAFNFFSPIGANYQGGDLDMVARITIQMMHRYWACVVPLYLIGLSCFLITTNPKAKLKNLAWLILIIVIIQFILGVLNVELLLPISVAVLHNGFAALLLLSLVMLIYKLYTPPVMKSHRRKK